VRLPFPERIPLLYVICFAAVLCVAQLLEGTTAVFALCSFVFIFIAAVAFNLAGGFTRPSGSYVFFYAVLGIIVGLCWKAILAEPADSNLTFPIVTIEVYLVGICAMLAAVFISRKLVTKRALLGTMLTEANTQNATVGCMITGLLLILANIFVPHDSGSVLSAIGQIDRFLPLAIIIGVRHQIKKTGGARSFGWAVILSMAVSMAIGLITFSKEGMFTPLLCWVVAACSMRYRLVPYQIIGGLLFALFTFQFLVPYSQYGREYRSTSLSQSISSSISLLSNLGYVRQQYEDTERDEDVTVGYYNTPQGFFDRLQMISIDDALIGLTEQGHVFGLYPVWSNFENLIPHFLWPNKPRLYWGTVYAHEIGGLLPEDDTTTGISFTPTAEAFHLARWLGLLVVAPVLWIMLFTIFDSLCGDTRKSPWGLLVMALFAHSAPESGLSGPIYMMGYGSFSIIIAALFTSYVLPIVGTLLVGPENRTVRRTSRVRSVARRISDARSIQA
jgi:hypothetical protein